MNTFKYFLAENMSKDQRAKALSAAMGQLEKNYGKGKWFDPDTAKAEQTREKRNKEHVDAQKHQQEARAAQHERNMKDDPEYRKNHEEKLKQSKEVWKSYGDKRANRDPLVTSKGNWSGD